MNRNGQVKETWDFVARHATVAEDHPHGMQCLSIIAANIPGQFVGSAPKADFYLYRTEDAAPSFPLKNTTGYAPPNGWTVPADRLFLLL